MTASLGALNMGLLLCQTGTHSVWETMIIIHSVTSSLTYKAHPDAPPSLPLSPPVPCVYSEWQNCETRHAKDSLPSELSSLEAVVSAHNGSWRCLFPQRLPTPASLVAKTVVRRVEWPSKLPGGVPSNGLMLRVQQMGDRLNKKGTWRGSFPSCFVTMQLMYTRAVYALQK